MNQKKSNTPMIVTLVIVAAIYIAVFIAEQLLPDIVPLSLPSASAAAMPAVPVQSPAPEVRANCANRVNRATARLTIGDASIEVDDQVSEAFLLSLIKAVRHA